jgi:hypothetical protein
MGVVLSLDAARIKVTWSAVQEMLDNVPLGVAVEMPYTKQTLLNVQRDLCHYDCPEEAHEFVDWLIALEEDGLITFKE